VASNRNDNSSNVVSWQGLPRAEQEDLVASLVHDRAVLTTINAFALSLISITSKEELAWYVAREVVGKLGFVDCVIYLRDDNNKILHQSAANGTDKNPSGNEIVNALEIPFGEGITGHAAITKKSLIVDNLENDSRYIPDIIKAQSEIAVPMLIDDEVVGVIDCKDQRLGHFNGSHLEILCTVAAMTSSKLKLISQTQIIHEAGKLAQSEKKVRDFAQAASDWFWETDREHKFTHFSGHLQESSGVKPAIYLGKPRWEIDVDGNDEVDWEAHKQCLDEHQPFRDFRYAIFKPEFRYVQISGIPVYDTDGEFQGYRGSGTDITSEFLSEKALLESEQRFKDFSNVASDWFWESDENNRFKFISDRFEDNTGIKPELYIGKTREETRPQMVDDDIWENFLGDMAAHREFRNVVFARLQENGAERWLSISGRPYFDEQNNFLGYRGTGRNITEEKKNSFENQRSLQLLYTAIEVMEDGFILFDAEDRMVICNQKYKQMHPGYNDLLVPGISFREISELALDSHLKINSPQEKEAWLDRRMEIHLNPKGPFERQLLNGKWERVIEQKTAEGGIVSLRVDITQEKEEEAKLRKLSHALEQSPSMVFITDIDGNIEYVNAMFCQLSGYTADEVIGKNPRILQSGETPAQVYEDLWKTIKSGKEWRGELKDHHKDGSSFWAYAIISPVRSENGEITHFVSMHEDITPRKEVEIRERQAKEQAEMANRAKSELLANMSHELRTPLNAIIGFSDMIQSEVFGSLNSKYLEYTIDIKNSGEHLLELINDILDVSAIEAGKLKIYEEILDVGRVIEATTNMVMVRADQGEIFLKSEISDDLPLLNADKRRLMQIFLNLMSNAIKFTPAGGEVTVCAMLDDENAHVISVSDTGVGMDEDELIRAFAQFSQVDSGLDRMHEGSGLGLPLTQGLVELHGGSLESESEKGKGTTITVKFPPERTIASL